MTKFCIPCWILIVVALAGSPACHRPVTIVTPQGKVAYTADQIVVRVNELQATAIAAEKSGGLPTATTRTLVEFCVAADQTLAATPSGWQATLATLWTSTKGKIPQQTNPAIVAAMSAVDVVIGAYQP